MATWDEIDVDFGGDETGNFGPRLESGTALYQVDTTATISPKGEVTDLPHIKACAVEEDVCVAVDGYFSLFSGHEFLFNGSLDCEVDALTYSDDGRFLVIADCMGVVHFFYVETQSNLFSKTLVSNVTPAGATFKEVFFTQADEEGYSSLVIVTAVGQVHLFNKLPLAELDDALSTGKVDKAKALQGQMKHCFVDASGVHTVVTTTAAVIVQQYGYPMLLTAGLGGCHLCVWLFKDGAYQAVRHLYESPHDQGAGVLKMKVVSSGHHVVVLNEKHELVVHSIFNLLPLKTWSQSHVDDFLLIETPDSSSSLSGVKLVFITPSGDGSQTLQVCSLPHLQAVYSIQLGAMVQLAQCPGSQEGIYFIEGVPDETGFKPHLVTSLRVRCLTEALPETRFYRLLHKCQFDAAEAFAKQFYLDVELVYTTKASFLLEKVAPWNEEAIESAEHDEALKDLRACLTCIKDDNFVVDCCIKANPASFAATLDLLNYARQRLKEGLAIQNGHCTEEEDLRPALMTKLSLPNPLKPGVKRKMKMQLEQHRQVLETLHRLATFQVAYGTQNFEAQHWYKFQQADLMQQMLLNMFHGKTNIAFTIWRRHQIEFKDRFEESVLSDILQSIPENTPSDELCPWLAEDLIPYTLRILPESVSLLASWLEQRARNMEILEKHGWPMNAVQLCELLHTSCVSITESSGEQGLATPKAFAAQLCYSLLKGGLDESSSEADPFVRLHTLIGHLRDLHSLHTRYNCKLTLAEYLQETVESLTYRMLDRVVAIELIPKAIQNVVRPYMKEHGLSEDRMLFQYIGDLAERSGKVTSYLGEAPWEAKAIAVISNIQDPDYKGRAILDAMMRAHTPWSEDMEALVKEGLALKHSRVLEIQEKCRFIKLKNMLIAYEIRFLDISSRRSAEHLVTYILTQDRDTALQDALAVVHACNHLNDNTAYLIRLRQLIEFNRLAEWLEMLHSIPADNATFCGRRIINYTTLRLNDTVFRKTKSCRMEKILYTEASCHILKMLLKSPDTDECEKLEFTQLLKTLKNISMLQLEFGEFITLDDYREESKRKAVLERYTRQFFSKKTSMEPPNADLDALFFDKKMAATHELTYTKLYHLAEILGYTREEFHGLQALAAAKTGNLVYAIKMCRELFECLPTSKTGIIMYQVAHELCQLMQKQDSACSSLKGHDLPAVIKELANKAIIVCPAGMLADCLELCQCASLTYDIARQCESGDYGVTLQRHSSQKTSSIDQDPFTEWTFSPIFHEDGLVMDSTDTLPLAYGFANSILPIGDDSGSSTPEDAEESKPQEPLTQLSGATLPLVRHLRENSQMELALQVSIHALTNAIQQVQSLTLKETAQKAEGQGHKQAILKAMMEGGQKEIMELVEILMVKVFNKTPMDHGLALGLTCTLPATAAWDRLAKILERAGLHYKRQLGVAKVGIDFAEMLKEPKFLAKCTDLERTAYWGYRLAKLKISFKEGFNTQGDKGPIIEKMVQNEQVDVDLLKEFCSAFEDSEDPALFMYLTHLVLSPSDTGDVASHVRRWKEIQPKAERVVEELSIYDNAALLKVLLKLDPYDYERLQFLHNFIHEQGPIEDIERGLKLLQYLNGYKRVAPPSEYEKNYRSSGEDDQLVYGSSSLPEASKERLPLHPLIYGEPWKIISAELNAETVSIWLPVITLMNLSSDQMYLTAIQNMVMEHVKSRKVVDPMDKASANWDQEEGVDQAFFTDIRSLLMRVSNCEMAMICSNWLVKELPMGAEKVLALQSSATLAAKWVRVCKDNSPEKKKAEETYLKFSRYYCRLATEQVLFLHGLGEPQLLELANCPQKLVVKLYEHPSISQPVVGRKMPDIHSAVEVVAKINNLSVENMRVKLVECWLPSCLQSKQDEADMTITFDVHANMDMTVRSEEDMIEDAVNLKRVTYLLQQGCLETNALFLLNYAFKSNTTKISNMCRVRALHCLFSLVSRATVEKLYQESIIKIKECLQALLYVVQLERLHMSQTTEGFQKCSKEGLVRSLIRNHSHERRAVRLVADVCLDYNIYDVTLWNTILQQLMAFQMMEYLRHVLVELSRVPSLWQVECVQRMWRTVLLAPLSQAVPPLSDPQLLECLNAANLLHRCPLLLDMEVVTFVKQFLRLELPVLAAACVQLLPQDDLRDQQMAVVLQQYPVEEVLQQLAGWKKKGYMIPLNEKGFSVKPDSS